MSLLFKMSRKCVQAWLRILRHIHEYGCTAEADSVFACAGLLGCETTYLIKESHNKDIYAS